MAGSHLGSGAAQPHQGLDDTAWLILFSSGNSGAGRKELEVLPSSCPGPQSCLWSRLAESWGQVWLIPAQNSSHFTAAVASQGLAAPCRITSSHPAGSVSLSPGCCWLFLQEQQPSPPGPGCFGSLGRSLCCPLLLASSLRLCSRTQVGSLDSSFQHHVSASVSSQGKGSGDDSHP